MRVRRAFAMLGAVGLACGCFLLYLMMDLTFPAKRSTAVQDFQENKWLHFEGRLEQLERNLNKHHEAVGEIQRAIGALVSTSSSHANKALPSWSAMVGGLQTVSNFSGGPSEMQYDQMCPIQVSLAPRTNIQMLELYKELKFDNPDGGVWKQGWNINYEVKQWNNHHKLKVFLVPHSHNDPGWLKTFEEYFLAQTKHILDNMVKKLPETSNRKFIWAEVSYLAFWWNNNDDTSRNIVKKLLNDGQLEIVTGGWVMNDEANSHWTSMVHQLSEGHQWLIRQLNYTPKSSWSIDPFGQGPTMVEILRTSGLKHLLIQRVHYSVKKYLAMQRQLEFRWKQLWDGSDKTSFFTHLMPFYSYDVPHTCGPDPKVCCQFDFKRLPGHGVTCPWRIPAQKITESNVAPRAELLLDQYRKKAQLYQTNVLFVPLGDDFRYDHPTEWDNQYGNYQMLFDYMNSNPALNVEAKFGTLTEYFEAVLKEKSMEDFPTLTGDFFTYADRDDHYWSGYYTSRPLYKRMDRILLASIRAADIILVLAHGCKHSGANQILSYESGLTKLMTEARQSLSLFQHHDGITGTARDHVVIDYGEKMLHALSDTHNVIQQAANVLLNGPSSGMPGLEMSHYFIDDAIKTHDGLPERSVIMIGRGASFKKIVLFNSLTFSRHEVVRFLVSTPFVQVTDLMGNIVECQVSPVFEHGTSVPVSKFELVFVANIPAFSLVTYTVQIVEDQDIPSQTKFSSVKIFNHYAKVELPPIFTNIEVTPSAREFTIRNDRITAAFNKLGLLKAIRIGSDTVPVHLDFAKYGVRQNSERSGAYLFLPDGDAQPLNIESTIVKVIQGPLFSSVVVQVPKVHHTVTLYNTTGADGLGLEIENIVDILETSNYELVMRLSTNIASDSEFFSDLNGFQILRRRRFPKLPIQANYYPIPTMAYLEDKTTRLSVLTAGPLGCSSLKEGQLEIMMDRRLNQDDNRGLGQGVLDNHPTKHVFRVILEKRKLPCQSTADNHPSGFHTVSTQVSSQTLLNPIIKLLRNDDSDMVSERGYTPTTEDFGVDFSIAILKAGVLVGNIENNIGLVVHRQQLDTCYADKMLLQQFQLSHGAVNISDMLHFASNMKKASLTFLYIGDEVNSRVPQTLCPMETQAYLISR